MIDGTAAKLLILISIKSNHLLRGANISKYKAANTAIGNETKKATSKDSAEPISAALIPANSGSRESALVKKPPVKRQLRLVGGFQFHKPSDLPVANPPLALRHGAIHRAFEIRLRLCRGRQQKRCLRPTKDGLALTASFKRKAAPKLISADNCFFSARSETAGKRSRRARLTIVW